MVRVRAEIFGYHGHALKSALVVSTVADAGAGRGDSGDRPRIPRPYLAVKRAIQVKAALRVSPDAWNEAVCPLRVFGVWLADLAVQKRLLGWDSPDVPDRRE